MVCGRGWLGSRGGLRRWSCGPGSRVSSHIPPTMATSTVMPVTIKARRVPVVMANSGPALPRLAVSKRRQPFGRGARALRRGDDFARLRLEPHTRSAWSGLPGGLIMPGHYRRQPAAPGRRFGLASGCRTGVLPVPSWPVCMPGGCCASATLGNSAPIVADAAGCRRSGKATWRVAPAGATPGAARACSTAPATLPARLLAERQPPQRHAV